MWSFLLLTHREGNLWEVITGPGKRAKQGARFSFGDGILHAEILEVLPDGNRLAQFSYEGNNFYEILDQIGQMPLPHYITAELTDNEQYQTVYSKELGLPPRRPPACILRTSCLIGCAQKG